MKLVVKNFGPIKEAVIDLSKKHYFFVGYNNTGKTYMSKLIYDIFSKKNSNDFAEFSDKVFRQNKDGNLVLTDKIIKDVIEEFAVFLRTKVITRSLKVNRSSNFILKNLEIYFQYDIKEIKELHLSSKVTIGFLMKKEDNPEGNFDILFIEKKENSLLLELSQSDNNYDTLPSHIVDSMPKKVFTNHIKTATKNVILQSVLSLLLQNQETPFFLPANRSFILENANVLIVDESQKQREFVEKLRDLSENPPENMDRIKVLLSKGYESNQTVHISNLIAEISKLRGNNNEDFIQNGTTFYDDLLVRLAKTMGGSIEMAKMSSFSNYKEQFVLSNTDNQTLDLFLASSSANQLSILYLYLKYWAKASNNFLILDEPEENLSPLNQVRILDLLLDFANKNNNKILVTTHSPLLGQMLNNYLTLGQLENRAEIAEQLGFQDKNVNPENTGIYYFNGETVSETTISNYGAIYQSFKSVEEEVYQINDYLGNLMIQQTNKK